VFSSRVHNNTILYSGTLVTWQVTVPRMEAKYNNITITIYIIRIKKKTLSAVLENVGTGNIQPMNPEVLNTMY